MALSSSDVLAKIECGRRGDLHQGFGALRGLFDGSIAFLLGKVTTLNVVTAFQRNGVDKTTALDLAITKATQRSAAITVSLSDLRQKAAMQTLLPAAADGTTLGLAAAAGSVVLGTSASANAKSETASCVYVLPADYVAGTDIVATLRAKVGVAPQVAATSALSAKKVTDGVLGSNLVATAVVALTTAYADDAQTITGATLNPGDVLQLDVTLASNDTGGAHGSAASMSKFSLAVPITT